MLKNLFTELGICGENCLQIFLIRNLEEVFIPSVSIRVTSGVLELHMHEVGFTETDADLSGSTLCGPHSGERDMVAVKTKWLLMNIHNIANFVHSKLTLTPFDFFIGTVTSTGYQNYFQTSKHHLMRRCMNSLCIVVCQV